MAVNELRRLVARSKALADGGRWDDEAIGVNTRILELDDRIAVAYTRLGRCFQVRRNWLAARSMYQQVLAFDPTNLIASNQLAAVNEKLRDLDDAELIAKIEDYREAVSIGVAARRQGKAALAVAALKRAVVLDPTSYALTALGAAYRASGQLEKAEAAYRRAMKLDDQPAARVGLAAVLADQNRLTEAHKLYLQVLRADNRNVFALNGLGALLLKRGRLEMAKRCFMRASAMGQASDESTARLDELRTAYSRRGDADGARRIQTLLGHLTSPRHLVSTES